MRSEAMGKGAKVGALKAAIVREMKISEGGTMTRGKKKKKQKKKTVETETEIGDDERFSQLFLSRLLSRQS